jgi:hypothetical protein
MCHAHCKLKTLLDFAREQSPEKRWVELADFSHASERKNPDCARVRGQVFQRTG